MGCSLGDRIRINSCQIKESFLVVLLVASLVKNFQKPAKTLERFKDYDYDLIVETSGIGQGDSAIASLSDLSLYVMTPRVVLKLSLKKSIC